MASTPEFNGEQLATVRSARFHQNGDALLTLDAAREWLAELGLVLFAPRTHQLSAPAPSLLEATLGRAVPAPSAAETETARSLLARLVAEGTALPLNLLGGPGDLPDFVVSSQAFSYVFTLRGDKAWKQPPSTAGAASVSPLAAKVYGVLAERGALTAGELVSDLGRELTENAVARALTELWVQLRAIPLLQQDGAATLWELTSRRFTRAIKAGANAGQPTALSALASLYLAQVYAATEEEIETFLSPLAPRSRVRDVLHGLSAGRQLDPVVLEGKTLLYIPGALPEFPELGTPEPEEAAAEAESPAAAPERTDRIRSFAGRRKPAEEFRGKPARDAGRPPRREGGVRPTRRVAPREEGKGERERRPFQRSSERPQSARGERSGFARPWDEERRPKRPVGEGGDRREGDGSERPRFDRADRERPRRPREAGGAGRGFGGGAREGRRPEREGGEQKSFRPRKFEGERENRRPGGFGQRGPRSERPANRGGERPSRRSGEGADRPPRRPFPPRERESGERNSPGGRGGDRGSRPGGFGGKRGYTPRGAEEAGRPAAKRPFKSRAEGGAGFRPRPEGAPPKKGFGGGKRFGDGGRPKFGRPGSKPGGGPGTKFGGRTGGTGAKRSGPPLGSKPRKPEAEE